MEWLLQPEYLATLLIPAAYWLSQRAVQSLKDFISERADMTDKKVENFGKRVDAHEVRLDGHDQQIVDLKVEAGWLRGRLGEPLDHQKED